MTRFILAAAAVAAAVAVFGIYKVHEGSEKSAQKMAVYDCHFMRKGSFWNSARGKDGKLVWFRNKRTTKICRNRNSPTGWVKAMGLRNAVLVSTPPLVVIDRVSEMFAHETRPLCVRAVDPYGEDMLVRWTIKYNGHKRVIRLVGYRSIRRCITFRAGKPGRVNMTAKVWNQSRAKAVEFAGFWIYKPPKPPSVVLHAKAKATVSG